MFDCRTKSNPIIRLGSIELDFDYRTVRVVSSGYDTKFGDFSNMASLRVHYGYDCSMNHRINFQVKRVENIVVCPFKITTELV